MLHQARTRAEKALALDVAKWKSLDCGSPADVGFLRLMLSLKCGLADMFTLDCLGLKRLEPEP